MTGWRQWFALFAGGVLLLAGTLLLIGAVVQAVTPR